MSKVKIQGNASGTGIFTVSAPATNTDRTITLPDTSSTLLAPDSTGSIQLDYAGSNNYLNFISSSNYVGRNASTGDIWLNAQGGQGVVLGVGGTSQLKVDGNGRVTKPSQPAFMQISLSGYNTVGYLKGTGSGYSLNRGNHYNATTGRFTAPIAGTYIFMCAILVESGTGRLEGYISISGTQRNSFNGTGTTYDGTVAVVVTEMNAGDYAMVVRQSGTAHSDGGHPSTYFGGYLLG